MLKNSSFFGAAAPHNPEVTGLALRATKLRLIYTPLLPKIPLKPSFFTQKSDANSDANLNKVE